MSQLTFVMCDDAVVALEDFQKSTRYVAQNLIVENSTDLQDCNFVDIKPGIFSYNRPGHLISKLKVLTKILLEAMQYRVYKYEGLTTEFVENLQQNKPFTAFQGIVTFKAAVDAITEFGNIDAYKVEHKKTSIEDLQFMLDQAIETEDYEQAAILRDKINQYENGNGN